MGIGASAFLTLPVWMIGLGIVLWRDDAPAEDG
jgi:hypothetical protein